MQHTDKYKLNLIEKDDVFSPDALNDNAEKVESVLVSLANGDREEAEARDALAQRDTALEEQKILFGTGAYETSPQTVSLGFKPKAVLLMSRIPGTTAAMVVGEKYVYHVSGGRETVILKIVENGFTITSLGSNFFTHGEHNYIAFV